MPNNAVDQRDQPNDQPNNQPNNQRNAPVNQLVNGAANQPPDQLNAPNLDDFDNDVAVCDNNTGNDIPPSTKAKYRSGIKQFREYLSRQGINFTIPLAADHSITSVHITSFLDNMQKTNSRTGKPRVPATIAGYTCAIYDLYRQSACNGVYIPEDVKPQITRMMKGIKRDHWIRRD
ncbi:hypothetical protein HDU85_002172 [Gaertneriomyces sp. JEL0708]|nr:hypothetical protein HDU85_002172 [Gaertneriomyces sp. JEL0708]